jgi:hypothetical protein
MVYVRCSSKGYREKRIRAKPEVKKGSSKVEKMDVKYNHGNAESECIAVQIIKSVWLSVTCHMERDWGYKYAVPPITLCSITILAISSLTRT